MASRKVASLYVDVSASTASLTKGLNRAKSKINKFQRATKKQFAGIKRAVFSAKGALLGFAGVGGLGLLISSAMKSADEVGKMSDRLNMSAEGFQALHHQAGLFGVSSKMVNSSVERMVKRLGEAANGTGAAKVELEKLGLSAKKLINLNADEQYNKIAEAIGGLGTHSERAAATAAIFGREGIKMVNMLSEGAGGIASARKEIDEFGIALDRVQIKKIENANDAFHRVSGVIKGAGSVIAAELSPYLEAAAKWFLEVTKQAGGVGEVTQSAMSGAATAIGWVITAVDYLNIGYETLRLGVLSFAAVSLKAFDALLTPARELTQVLGMEQPEALKFVTHLAGEFEQSMIAGQAKLVGMIGTVGQNADIAKGKLTEIKQAANDVANIQVNAAATASPEQAAANEYAIAEDLSNKKIELAIFEMDKKAHLRQIDLDNEKASRQAQIKGASDTFGALSGLMSAKSKKLFKIGKAAAIASALINTYQAITKTMASTPYPWNIPLAAAQGVAGMVQVQNIKSQQYGGAKAFGGEVIAGKRYTVGESGMEQFVPKTDGTIIPNDEIGGKNQTVNINIAAHDTASVESMFNDNRQSLYNTIVDAMNENGVQFV